MASRDLTTGSIPRHLMALGVPVIGAMLLQSVYAIVDLAWIKRLGEESVAGLSINFQIFFVILALSQVIATTAMADMSQLWGKGEREGARGAFSSFLLVALVLGVLTTGGAWLTADAYVNFFTSDPAVAEEGLAYFQINALTFFSQLLLIVLGYGLRASGDFISPMVVMIFSVLVNLVLDPLLIFGVGDWEGMGIAGAAWATVAGQFLALVAYIGLLIRARTDDARMSFGMPSFNLDFFKQLIVRGLPAGTQYLLMSAMLGVVLYAMKPHGAAYTAAAGGGFRILQQSILPVVALASAAAAMAGQNMGSGGFDRVRLTSRTVLIWCVVYGGVISGLFLLTPELFASLFAQPEEMDVARSYFVWSWPMVIGISLSMGPTMILQALKRPILPLIAAVVRLGLIVVGVFAWLVPTQAPPEWVFGLVAVTAIVEGAIGVGLLIWRLRRLPDDSPAPKPAIAG
ncbi:MAG: putative MATE family efflux protein [Cognaticolwellia sp.]|jgi:putative MATE family efflux protein